MRTKMMSELAARECLDGSDLVELLLRQMGKLGDQAGRVTTNSEGLLNTGQTIGQATK
jgi:hypothetical protein